MQYNNQKQEDRVDYKLLGGTFGRVWRLGNPVAEANAVSLAVVDAANRFKVPDEYRHDFYTGFLQGIREIDGAGEATKQAGKRLNLTIEEL